MEKNCAKINEIRETVEQLISSNFDEKTDIGFDTNDSLSERLDSMAICLLIVQLEEIYKVEFPIESFCKNDTAATISEKFYDLLCANN